jgi:hypothetical protein
MNQQSNRGRSIGDVSWCKFSTAVNAEFGWRMNRKIATLASLVISVVIGGCAAPVVAPVAVQPEQGVGQCDPLQLENSGVVATALGVSTKRLSRMQQLTGLRNEGLCRLSPDQLAQVNADVVTARTGSAQRLKEYLDDRQRDANGNIPGDGYFREILQREAMQQPSAPTSRSAHISAAGLGRNNWTWLGPAKTVGGRVRSLLIDADNPARMWAGSSTGGIWNSSDGGNNWQSGDRFTPAFAVSKLAQDPINHAVLYAATGRDGNSAGIWKSINRGGSWQLLAGTAPSVGVSVKVPTGAGSQLLYPFVEIRDLHVVKADGNILIVASQSGLYKSINGGASWSAVLALNSQWPYMPSVDDVVGDPAVQRRVLASTGRGTVAIGENIGTAAERWQEVKVAPGSTIPVLRVAFAPSTPGLAYATTGLRGGSIYRSTDGGLNWQYLTTNGYCGGQCFHNNALFVDPVDSRRLLLGGINMYQSLDGGANWVNISAGKDLNYIHSDHHVIMPAPGYNGLDNSRVYFANDGGVYRTDNPWGKPVACAGAGCASVTNPVVWEALNVGLGASQFYAVAVSADGKTVVGGTQDNYSQGIAPAVGDWTNLANGDGGHIHVERDGLPIYTSGQNVDLVRVNRFVTGKNHATGLPIVYPETEVMCDGLLDAAEQYRYVNGGRTFACGVPGYHASNALFIPPTMLDPNGERYMVVGGASLWRSSDVTAPRVNWQAIRSPQPDRVAQGSVSKIFVSAVVYDPRNGNTLYVGYTDGSVWVSYDARATKPIFSRLYQHTSSYATVSSLYVRPDDSQRVIASFTGYAAGSIVGSEDGGRSWRDLHTSLPTGPVNWVTEHPAKRGLLYAGLQTGLYGSGDGGQSWAPETEGPAIVPVNMMVWQDNRTLIVATYGRGVWRATIDLAANVIPVSMSIRLPQRVTGTLIAPQALVRYSDGQEKTVTPQWSPSGIAGATITGNTIVLPPQTQDQRLALTARYSEGGVSVSAMTNTIVATGANCSLLCGQLFVDYYPNLATDPSRLYSTDALANVPQSAALNLYGIFSNLTVDASLDLYAALQLPNGIPYFAADLPNRTDPSTMLLPSFTAAAKPLVRSIGVYPVSGTQSSRTGYWAWTPLLDKVPVAGLPVGKYVVYAVLVPSGLSVTNQQNWASPLVVKEFTIR